MYRGASQAALIVNCVVLFCRLPSRNSAGPRPEDGIGGQAPQKMAWILRGRSDRFRKAHIIAAGSRTRD